MNSPSLPDPRTKTARNWKNLRLVTWVNEHYSPSRILDFGCGKYLVGVRLLKESGWEVDGYDLESYQGCYFASNPPPGQYPIVMLSNVLNVQETLEDLRDTVREAWKYVETEGVLAANYCQSPRRLPLTPWELHRMIGIWLRSDPTKVDGMWVYQKVPCSTEISQSADTYEFLMREKSGFKDV